MKSGAGAFDVDEFVSKLVTFMGGRKFGNQIPEEVQSDAEDDEDDPDMVLDWTIIGRKALAKTHRAPAIGFMYVTFSTFFFTSTFPQAGATFT